MLKPNCHFLNGRSYRQFDVRQHNEQKQMIQWCSVGGGAGPFWAVRWWWWWCWSGSLCPAGAGLLTFLEHPIMCPPLLEDIAKWFSWMMAYRSLQMCDLIWFKFQNCCKTTATNGWSTLNVLQGTWHACLAKFVENKVWETHCSEALTVSSVNVYFKSPDVPHLISTSQGMSLYCYRGSLYDVDSIMLLSLWFTFTSNQGLTMNAEWVLDTGL